MLTISILLRIGDADVYRAVAEVYKTLAEQYMKKEDELTAKGKVEKVADKFVGPTALVMSYDDVIAPAKVLADFMKDRENFAIRTAVVEGKLVDAKGIQALAKMPGLLELRGQIAAMIAQPATKLARTLAAPGQQLALVLAARRDQLGKAQ